MRRHHGSGSPFALLVYIKAGNVEAAKSLGVSAACGYEGGLVV